MLPYILRKQETDRELFFVDLRFFWTREQNCDLLHFVGFFHVASLFSIRVDNEKALELDNSKFSDQQFNFQGFSALGLRFSKKASKK